MKVMLSFRKPRQLARAGAFLLTLVLIAGLASCGQCIEPMSCTIGCVPPDPPVAPVEIWDWEQLDAIRNNLRGSYVLMTDLDSRSRGYDELASSRANAGKGWEPIGTMGQTFRGTLDGQGRTISGLVINRPDEDHIGLFGHVFKGTITNVSLYEVDVIGKEHVGALAGRNQGGSVISDAAGPLRHSTTASGTVRGASAVGGLVGSNVPEHFLPGGSPAEVLRCNSTVMVFHADGKTGEYAGGLVGLNSGRVIDCEYNGEVTGVNHIGGMVGVNDSWGTVIDCIGSYSVRSEGGSYVGGVAGRNVGAIRRADFIGDVVIIVAGGAFMTLNEAASSTAVYPGSALPGSYVGGVVGLNEGTLEECEARANVTGASNVGGLAGANHGTMEDCHSEGDVQGASNVGGLVGLNQGTISDSSSRGDVAGVQAVGLLVGRNAATGIVSGCDYTGSATVVDASDLVGINEGQIQHILKVSSTTGGSVTRPGAGTFSYDAGEVVTLIAAPSAGYRFANWTGDVETIEDASAAWTEITMLGNYEIAATFDEYTPGQYTPMVAAGFVHTVGLKSDGTVVAVGYCDDVDDDWHYGQCDVSTWTEIVQVDALAVHTVGLRSDGTVVAVGACDDADEDFYHGQCNVSPWRDVVQVAAGGFHTVGLKSDGTAVAVGSNEEGQCNVGTWRDIVQVAAGGGHTVGLKSDGTAVAVGSNEEGQCNVGDWTDIIKVAAGAGHTVGLKSDGTVVAVGANEDGQCDVGTWRDIVQVAAGYIHTLGLRSDRTVVAVGACGDIGWFHAGQCKVGDWTDIVQVAAGAFHTVGLRSDGTVVAVGACEDTGLCDVDDWMLN